MSTRTYSVLPVPKEFYEYVKIAFANSGYDHAFLKDGSIDMQGIAIKPIAIKPTERTCRVCGCTDMDCSKCIEKTGQPCYWIDENLCSACKNAETENQAD